jgi:glycosyltransferase involved in cell wall biosynthesis
MNIAFIVHKFPPHGLGGVEVYTWSLARALSSAGHEVHVFYPLSDLPSADYRVDKDGVHLWRAPLPQSRSFEDPLRQYWHTFRDFGIEASFRRFLVEVQPQVVHYQHVQGVSARLVDLAKGRPRLLSLHDYWFFCFNSQLVRPDQQLCSGPKLGWNCVDCATTRPDLHKYRLLRPLVALPLAYRNQYLRRIVGQVDLLVAPSVFVRQQYIHQGFPAERIVTMANGLDLGRLVGTPRSALQSPPARPHFGYIGSIGWHKGVHVLVEAFNQLSPNAALTIYGNTDVFPDYAAKVQAMVRHPHVRFAGQLDYQHVGDALRQLDCLIVPSVCCESYSLVVQEAFAAGVPVVASRLGALPEKVQDGITGRLFTAGDPVDLAGVLKELTEQPEQLALLAKNTRPGPDIHRHGELLVQIYQALVAGTPAGEIADEVRRGGGELAEA